MNDSLTEPPFTPVWARKFKENFFFIYNGSSMAPLFKPGDLLCAYRPVWGNIHPGDIVIVNWGSSINHPKKVVHRVVSVRQNNLITRGDNNLKADSEAALNDNLVGLVIAFGRKSHIYSARGGCPGLFYSYLVHMQNYIWMLIKRPGRRVYRKVQQSGLIAKVWRPSLSRIHIMTDEGPLVKYRFGTRTIARWWLVQKRFDVVKPFDLVLSAPEDPK